MKAQLGAAVAIAAVLTALLTGPAHADDRVGSVDNDVAGSAVVTDILTERS